MHLQSSSMYSDALHIRLCMLCNSALPPASMPLHVLPLLVCLFVYLCHQCTCCLFCLFVSPSGLVPLIDGQWTSAKSDCTHSIRRGLGRRLRSSLLLNSVTPVTHQLRTSVLDLMQVRPCHMVTYGQTGCGRPRSRIDHQQDGTGFPIDVLFDFQHMYISRRGDTVRSPSLEINYSPCPLSLSLASSFVRLWQSKHQ